MRGLEEKRERLFASVKDSSERNRNFFIAWILFAAYISVIILSTSDLQLLKTNGAVALPIVGVQLPLLGFYLLSPILVVAVHFNLLQNLDTHAFKLKSWADTYRGAPPRETLSAFLFDYAALERGGAFGDVLRVCSDVLCFWLGPIVLALILLRFSDYQDPLFTSWHALILSFDVWLVIRVRSKQPGFAGPLSAHWRFCGVVFAGFSAVTIAAVTATVLGLSIGLAEAHDWMRLLTASTFNRTLSELVTPRLVAPAGSLFLPNDNDLDLRAKLEGASVGDWWQESGVGISWDSRSLAYSDLRGADLRRAQLNGANLQGANLIGAQLDKAELSGARLDGAVLGGAHLTGATMVETSLTGANLIQARLIGAILTKADLRKADLRGANFASAQLTAVQMDGAWLQSADFSGAVLSGAAFANNNFAGTQFLGARMYQVSMESPPVLAKDESNTPLLLAITLPADQNPQPVKSWAIVTNDEQRTAVRSEPALGAWASAVQRADKHRVLELMAVHYCELSLELRPFERSRLYLGLLSRVAIDYSFFEPAKWRPELLQLLLKRCGEYTKDICRATREARRFGVVEIGLPACITE